MKKELGKYFTELQKIQDLHMEVITADPFVPDTDQMIFERNRAFENLRNEISATPLEVVQSFQDEAVKIMEKDDQFREKLEERRLELMKTLRRNARGKEMLRGYRGSTHQSLRVMNTTG